MPQWGEFLAVVAVLTVTLLVLAHRSQQVLQEHAHDNEEPTGESAGPTPDDGEGPGQGEAPLATDSTDSVATVGDDGENGTIENDPGQAGTGGVPAGTPEGAVTAVEPSGAAVTAADSETVGEHTGDAGPGDGSETPAVVTTDSGEEVRLTTAAVLTNVASTQVAFAGAVVAAAWFLSIPASAFGVTAGPLTGGPAGVAVGLAFGLVLWLLSETSAAVADAVGMGYDETVRGLLAPESAPGWAALFLFVLPLIAVAEELLFRGALIGVPAAGFGVSPWLLAVVASVAFALGHGAQGRAGITVTGLLGFALAAGYIRTDSLLVVVVAHYVINAMEFFVHEALGVEDTPGLADLT